MTPGYWLLILMLIPIAGAVYAWLKFHTITTAESFGGVAAACVSIIACLQLSQCGLTADKETWSGYATSATYEPEWVDEREVEYTETVYEGTGKDRTARTVTKTRMERTTHGPEWTVQTSLGDMPIRDYEWEGFAHHGVTSTRGFRPDMVSGDPNDYSVTWETDPYWPRYPVNTTRLWVNKLRYSDSIINLPRIEKDEAKREGLFDYPEAESVFHSNRLLGDTNIPETDWERLNAYLGPTKQVNLILVNFGPSGTMDQAAAQRAYWSGGKKNDLVICIGSNPGSVSEWCYVFGWSERELVKQNLQSLFVDNVADASIVPKVKREIESNFQRFDWHQFDNLDVPVPWWGVLLAIMVTGGVQYAFYKCAHENEFTKRKHVLR